MTIRPRVGWLVVLILLSACSTTPRLNDAVLDPADLTAWQFQGRVGVSAGTEGFNASIDWTQKGQDSSVRLAGPLGAGSLQLQFGEQHLRLETSRGQILEDAQAQEAVQNQLGFAPPLEELRFWLLGMQAPGSEAMQERNPEGQLLRLTQLGWLVEYQEFQPQRSQAGLVSLPKRLRASREDLRLRVVIDEWRLGP